MSRLALSLKKRARVVSRPAVALSQVAILLISAPQIAAAGPANSGRVAGSLLISSVSQNEGTGGTTIFTFNVTHSGTSDPFSVTVATDRTFSGSDEATAADDYTSKTETFNFDGLDGETKNFNVAVQADSEVESDEFFQVETVGFGVVGAPVLGLPQNCPCVGLGEIKNDDVATTNITVSVANAAGPEGDEGETTKFDFTVTRTGDPGAFTVDVKTEESTLANAATEGKDYKAKTELALSFGATENTKTFTVDVIGDVEDEGDEQFLVLLSNALGSGVTIGDGQGLGTIQDEATDDGGDGGGGGGGDDGGGDDGGGGGDDGGGGGSITVDPTKVTFDRAGDDGFVTVTASDQGVAWRATGVTDPEAGGSDGILDLIGPNGRTVETIEGTGNGKVRYEAFSSGCSGDAQEPRPWGPMVFSSAPRRAETTSPTRSCSIRDHVSR